MPRPLLLDLFCCQGGAAKGYHDVGFDVVGVDIEDQPRYPYEFVRADAIEFLRDHHDGFDAVHASPPCQSYSRALKHMANPKPMLIDAVGEVLDEIGLPYVIENVEGAPMPEQSDIFGRHGTMVCGSGLGLPVYRHRLFEANFPLVGTVCDHSKPAMNPHNQLGRDRIYAADGRQDPEVVWRMAMGVSWMDKHGGRQCVPPAYTEFIGKQLMFEVAQRNREMAA